jgi:hypothetical protein
LDDGTFLDAISRMTNADLEDIESATKRARTLLKIQETAEKLQQCIAHLQSIEELKPYADILDSMTSVSSTTFSREVSNCNGTMFIPKWKVVVNGLDNVRIQYAGGEFDGVYRLQLDGTIAVSYVNSHVCPLNSKISELHELIKMGHAMLKVAHALGMKED